jgi:hypothetical protein
VRELREGPAVRGLAWSVLGRLPSTSCAATRSLLKHHVFGMIQADAALRALAKRLIRALRADYTLTGDVPQILFGDSVADTYKHESLIRVFAE